MVEHLNKGRHALGLVYLIVEPFFCEEYAQVV